MKKINWLVILPALFAVGLVYLLYAPELLKGRIDHFMLASGGITWGLICAGLVATSMWGDLNRGHRWWQTALLVLSGVAVVIAFLGAVIGITGAVLGSIAPDIAARHQTMHTISLFAVVYYLITLVTVQNRFQVAEETIVVLDGRVLYPEARFTLWPWFRYRVRAVDQRIGVPSLRMNLDFADDGTFEVEVRGVVVDIDIPTAKARGVATLDYYKLVAETKAWVQRCIRAQAGAQTLGGFLKRKPRPQVADLCGIVVTWDGKAEIELV